jgi:hypothetical protein
MEVAGVPNLLGDLAARVYLLPMQKIRIEQHSSLGLIWAAGWLFTIGYLKLSFWQGVFALVIWPYYVGAALAPL